MDNSVGAGFMAVFAVSGSVVLLSLQLHKRLLSDFMKKIEFELGSEKDMPKKKVRFADDVMDPSSENKEHRRKHLGKPATRVDLIDQGPNSRADGKLDTMPLNWQVMYKGIIEYRTLKGCNVSNGF
ncbi:hypothetical protein F0562_015907 [Nyssa sinensis]|uniref:Uncharacterized protein n=1 Tax=Nyssa sinensis TaxID=561372 RepID=A0A5J4ZI64_9ASTE|nr:hypothetical protein F0562_015907 [Nyssa sinensis]